MRRSLTKMLIEEAGLSEADLEEARRVRADKGGSLGDILVKKKLISEQQYLHALGRLYGLPVWEHLPVNAAGNEVLRRVPIQFLRKFLIVPLEKPAASSPSFPAAPSTDGPETPPREETAEPSGEIAPPAGPSPESAAPEPAFVIAVNDPVNLQPIDDLARLIGTERYEVVLASRENILSAINLSYDMASDSAEQLVQDMEENASMILTDIDATADLLDDTSDAPIIKLVNHIISQAIKARASDIHIEPYQDSFKVRYRVDGILYDLLTPPKSIQAALISRIKVMADLNIAEKRLPQDGRIQVRKGDQDIDIRISTLPTAFGERVVLRLLNKSTSLLELTELGIAPRQLKMVQRLVTSPNGIILMTGPTGSGKTTTLYAVLSSINKPEINIITVEDPIEYQLRGISQVQVNRKIGLTFAKGLRSIVRQDPDVILIGEIRDLETAEIAVQSALTGHLVFSTLHTNDSPSSITRLVDIGVEPFLISSSLLAVAAQRLVRVLCSKCKEAYVPDQGMLEGMGIAHRDLHGHTIYRARGCPECFQTGYRGRRVILELMPLDDHLKGVILKTYDANVIKSHAKGMISLRQDGLAKVLEGITTIEEVIRVTQQ